MKFKPIHQKQLYSSAFTEATVKKQRKIKM
uniref:Uncharacterized protein n=1 Tax=Rhizophora mucronata TaxID=61149 RepID=A0A2P2PVT6_RHIMU